MGNKPTDAEQRSRLTPEQYRVIQEHGTERPFTGEHNHNTQPGRYLCVVCGKDLFSSGAKYGSGSGWPSFWQPVAAANCGAHLGHVFEDGPQPTGQRFGINSAALDFKPESGS